MTQEKQPEAKEKQKDPEVKAEAKPETKAEVKAEGKAEAKPETKAVEAKAAAKPAEPAPAVPSLEEQLSEMKDKYLRALAENDNYRKRMAREMIDSREATRNRTIGEVVGIYDLLQMAAQQAQTAKDTASMRQGVEMIFGEFKKALKTWGVTIVEAQGQKFDPAVHEALSTQHSATIPEGIVMQQWKPGFKIGDRLLRPAAVVVSSGPEKPVAPEPPVAKTEKAAEKASEPAKPAEKK